MRKEKPLNLKLTKKEIEDMQILIYNKCMSYKWEPSYILKSNSYSKEDLRWEIFTFLMRYYPVQEMNNYEMYNKYLEKKIKQTHFEIENLMKKKMKWFDLVQIDNENNYVQIENDNNEDITNIKFIIKNSINEEITDAMLEDIYYSLIDWKRKNVIIKISFPKLRQKIWIELLKLQEEKNKDL